MPIHADTFLHSLLVVDDSVVQRDHSVRLARELGFQCIYEASDGADALRLLDLLTLPPDLLLIDLEMPGMDGVQLIEALHERGLHLPFIVASNRETALLESVEAMCMALGQQVLAALPKPLSAQSLRQGLQHWCHSVAPAHTTPAVPALDPAELAHAIAAHELTLHYQPKVDMRTGLLRGVEALVRWPHARLGMVPPDHFVPMAERCGQIHALTMLVADQAFAQAAHWNARGLNLSVAINLSPLLLDRAGLVQDIETLLHRHGLRPEQVVLELTESSLATCLGTALALLARLRLKGFGLSLDDFGTGFSSLLQLARVPFTEVKVDRCFVHGASHRKHLRVMLKCALELAQQLDMQSVAEGVETLEDWRLLQQLGCTTGQGWLIARAMPASDLIQWRSSHAARLPQLRADPQAA